eukprot:gene20445-biopygen13100
MSGVGATATRPRTCSAGAYTVERARRGVRNCTAAYPLRLEATKPALLYVWGWGPSYTAPQPYAWRRRPRFCGPYVWGWGPSYYGPAL